MADKISNHFKGKELTQCVKKKEVSSHFNVNKLEKISDCVLGAFFGFE
jgi:hypothetical protein